MTNSKYSCSCSEAMSQVMMTLTDTALLALIIQNDDVRFFRQARARDLKRRLGFLLAQPHLFQKFVERIKRHFDSRCGVVHRDDNIWLKQTDHLGGFRGVESAAASHRDQGHVHVTQSVYLSLRRGLLKIAQMRDRDAIVIKHI